MAHYFFDATSDDLVVTDFHGRIIDDGAGVRPAMREAAQAIRLFLGEELAGRTWTLEVRLGDSGRIAAASFDEVAAFGDGPGAPESTLLAA